MTTLILFLDADACDALSADFTTDEAYDLAVSRYSAAAAAGCAKHGLEWGGVEFLREGGATPRFRLEDAEPGNEFDLEDAASAIRHDAWEAAVCGA